MCRLSLWFNAMPFPETNTFYLYINQIYIFKCLIFALFIFCLPALGSNYNVAQISHAQWYTWTEVWHQRNRDVYYTVIVLSFLCLTRSHLICFTIRCISIWIIWYILWLHKSQSFHARVIFDMDLEWPHHN